VEGNVTTTIFLLDPNTLRVSFPYSAAAVDAIKQVDGATWDKAAKIWRVPVAKLDAVLRAFPDAAAAPEVFLAAPPVLPIQHFAEMCAAAGVTLTVQGERVHGAGGCWTPILQAEIDARAVQLQRLLASGWQPAKAPPPPVAPEPASYDRITHLDRVMAAGESNWLANEQRKQDVIDGAKRRKRKALFTKIDQQLGLEELLK
jgi:hypothetical protein